jgi:hypothetical protein
MSDMEILLILLQKKAICNIAKASYLDNTHPLFVQYKCSKFLDIVKLKTLIIMIIIYKANMFNVMLREDALNKQ